MQRANSAECNLQPVYPRFEIHSCYFFPILTCAGKPLILLLRFGSKDTKIRNNNSSSDKQFLLSTEDRSGTLGARALGGAGRRLFRVT